MPYFKYEGKNIFYREKGNGPLLVILPGNTASSIMHERELEIYSKDYHVVSIDFSGTGQSDRIETWDSNWWKSGANQVESLINHLEYTEAILMGTSGGANVALLTAIHYPALIKAVIADSFTEIFTPKMLKDDVIDDRSNPTDDQINFWKYCHGNDWKDIVTKDTEIIKDFVNSGGNSFEGRLSEIKVPVLITLSKQDPMIKNSLIESIETFSKLKKGKLFINDTGFHPLIWSKPDFFHRIVSAFLNDID